MTPNILVKLILSINRKESIESAEENVNLALKYHNLYPTIVCGIDLSGDPTCGNFNDFKHLLDRAKCNGMNLALHCGEIDNQTEINEILEFGMNRLGHGTFITGFYHVNEYY